MIPINAQFLGNYEITNEIIKFKNYEKRDITNLTRKVSDVKKIIRENQDWYAKQVILVLRKNLREKPRWVRLFIEGIREGKVRCLEEGINVGNISFAALKIIPF